MLSPPSSSAAYELESTEERRGILYIREDRWTVHYDLSIDLYDAAAESASALEKFQTVKSCTDELVENAHSFDDSLNCKF